ncbi:MAG: A24 family peptidase [Planctomycetaceae bacterium]
MVPAALAVLLLVAATVTDVLRHKIFNWTTYPGIVGGFLANWWFGGSAGASPGREALETSLLGFFVCGFIMLFCLLFFDIGGGDVKLIAMMGACLGLHQGIEAMLWTFILGAVLGVGMLVWQLGFLRIAGGVWRHLALMVKTRGWVAPTPRERGPLEQGLFLAPSALAATLIVTREHWLAWL